MQNTHSESSLEPSKKRKEQSIAILSSPTQVNYHIIMGFCAFEAE